MRERTEHDAPAPAPFSHDPRSAQVVARRGPELTERTKGGLDRLLVLRVEEPRVGARGNGKLSERLRHEPLVAVRVGMDDERDDADLRGGNHGSVRDEEI